MRENSWDAIFIGAGITSLVCAALLLKKNPGLKLLLIDKHIVPGGYASHFTRKGVDALFDCSLHKLSGVGSSGNLKRILDRLELSEITLCPPSPLYFYGCYQDKRYSLRNNPAEFEADLCHLFPQEKDAIRKFMSYVELYGKNSYFQFQIMDGSYLPEIQDLRYAHKHLKNKTVKEVLDELFKSDELKDILSAPGLYVGGFPEIFNCLYYLHIIYATLYMGNAYVKGSAQALSNALANRITHTQSHILLETKVRKVLLEHNHAIGVQTNKGDFFASKIYVNASPHHFMDDLLQTEIELTEVQHKLQQLKPAFATTTLYLVLDQPPETLGLCSSETMIFAHDFTQSIRLRQACQQEPDLCEEAYWIESTMEITNYHLLDKNNGKVVCINVLDAIGHWPKRKSMPYREKKQRATEILLNRFLKYFPQIEQHIIYQEMSTPRTYHKFTNNKDGSGYGAFVGTHFVGHTFHHQFPLKGIDFLSAWVAGPSYEAAFDYAEMKANQWRDVR